jgi:hypothetical protein
MSTSPRTLEAEPYAMNSGIAHKAGASRHPRLEACIFAIYLLLVIIGIANHEPWRDEIRAFAISLHANSPGSLITLIQHEGHPPLWHILLKPFTLFPNEQSLKLAGLMTGVASAWLLYRMPLTLWIRAGILLNYYWIYEYVVISRSYALGFLLSTLGLLLWLRQRSPVATGILFGLAANVHILIGLTNAPLYLYLLRHQISSQRRLWPRSALALSTAILLIGYGITFATISQTRAMKYGISRIENSVRTYFSEETKGRQLAPTKPGGTSPTLAPKSGQFGVDSPPSKIKSKSYLASIPTRITRSLRHLRSQFTEDAKTIRDFRRDPEAAAWIMLRISGTGIALAIALSTPLVALTYTMPAFAIAYALSEIIYSFSVVHNGIYTMVLIYSLALCRAGSRDPTGPRWLTRGWLQAIKTRQFSSRLGTASLTIFLIIGSFLGINAWAEDVKSPFSGGKAGGLYLRQQKVPVDNILIYDSPLSESGISLAYAMPALRADPAEAPTLLHWPRRPLGNWRSPAEVQQYCEGARALALSSNAKAALVRLINPMQPTETDQPLCEHFTVHHFPGIRETVQIELFEPSKPRQTITKSAP